MIVDQNFKEFVGLLNKNDVQYLIVGGYAVAYHGHPRYTKDLDVWIWSDELNAKKIISTLKEFGFNELGLTPEDLLASGNVIQLGYPPNRIDLLTSIDGVDFESCFESKIEVDFEEVTANFIDLENLKKNKKASGRHQDLADIESLK